MSENRMGMGVSLGATALALGLGLVAGRTLHNVSAPGSEASTEQANQQRAAETTTAQATTAQPAITAPSETEVPDGPKRYMVPVSDSQPSKGPKEALVTIVEWCDLPDSGCAALEPTLRELMDKHPQSLRLVFRHYGRPDHPGSPIAHHFVRAAHQYAGKFWQARELLLAHPGEFTMADAERYSNQLGLVWSNVQTAIQGRSFSTPISADRVFAGMFDVHGSPALFVNGRSLGDDAKPEALRELVEDELKHAQELVEGGVDKANLYAELTKHGSWNKPTVQ